ncbi:MAG: hypothetical protein OYH77_08560 [Pseudomonadota bacterium]|nr:hypothetical protein [Pseudomonadota bacterium]
MSGSFTFAWLSSEVQVSGVFHSSSLQFKTTAIAGFQTKTKAKKNAEHKFKGACLA